MPNRHVVCILLIILAVPLLYSQEITGSITGEVRDSEGRLACGVGVGAQQIDATPTTPRPTSRGTVSDANGRFVIKLDRAGKYRLIYNDDQHGYVPQYLPFFRDPNNPPPQVALTDDSPTAHVSISMSKNGAFTGQAIDARTLLPIDNVTFNMCHAEQRSTCWRMSGKSADGTFSVPTPFVPFTLKVTSPFYEDWFGMTGGENEQVSVPAGPHLPLQLVMRRKPAAVSLALNEAEKQAGINLLAPTQLSPIDNQAFDIYPRVTKLEWAPVEGAASYNVEIDYCDGFQKIRQCINPQAFSNRSNPASPNVRTTSYEFSFVGAQPGRWRVWAIDRDGREGFKSAWRTFVYLR